MDFGNYRIKAIPLNVVLQVKGKKGNYRDIGFFSTPANALQALVDKEVLATGLTDLQTITDRQNELYQLIEQIAPKTICNTPYRQHLQCL